MEGDDFSLGIGGTVLFELSRSFGIALKIGLVIDVAHGVVFDQNIRRARLFALSLIVAQLKDVGVLLNVDVQTQVYAGISQIGVRAGVGTLVDGNKGLPVMLDN